MKEYSDFRLYLLTDIYPLFIEQSRIDFNKGLFDLINNAYILEYLSVTIQVNNTFYTMCSIVTEQ